MVGLQSTLPRAILVVTATWTVIFSLLSLNHWESIPVYWAGGAALTFLGTAIGVSLYFIAWKLMSEGNIAAGKLKSKDVDIRLYLSQDPTKGDFITVKAPYPFSYPKRAPLDKNLLKELRRWKGYDDYVESYPSYGALFNAIASTLWANRDLKASHVEGGHAGLSLFEHSMNVLRFAVKVAPKYRYYGLFRNGKMSKPVRDKRGFYSFEPKDPLIPVIAIAHDIGKLVSYGIEDGKTVKFKEAHDIPGRRLLSLFKELYDIPIEDRHAILMAVGVYHHIHGGKADDLYHDGVFYSGWISDRIYAAVSFIEYADIQTGRIESGAKPQPFFVPYSEKQNRSDQRPAGQNEGKDIGGESVVEPGNNKDPIEEDRTHKEMEESSGFMAPAFDEPDKTPLDWFIQMVKANSKLEKGSKVIRYGDYLYVDDIAWRQWLKSKEKPIENPHSLLRQPSMGVIHPVTAQLLKELAEKGLLLLEAGGKRYSPINALYNVEMERKNGEVAVRKFVIVVSTKVCKEANYCKESSFPLRPIGSSFGEQRALRKTPENDTSSTKDTDESAGEAVVEEEIPVSSMDATIEDFLQWVTEVREGKVRNIPPFTEKKIDKITYVIVEENDIPDHLKTVDLSPLSPITRETNGTKLYAFPEQSLLGNRRS